MINRKDGTKDLMPANRGLPGPIKSFDIETLTKVSCALWAAGPIPAGALAAKEQHALDA